MSTSMNKRVTADGKPLSTQELEAAVEQSTRRVVRGAAGVRALGGGNLLSEPLAPLLAGEREMKGLMENRKKPTDGRTVENVAVRHCWFDEKIIDACLGPKGIKQVIVLNSGMDTRPYRLHLPQVTWFEIDIFEVLELKLRLLKTAPPAIGMFTHKRVKEIILVALDLMKSSDRLPTVLDKNGFKKDEPAVFVLEGLLYNFHDEDVCKLIQKLPQHPGNVLLCSAFEGKMLKWVRDSKNQQKFPFLTELAFHWRSSFDSMKSAGAFKGFAVTEPKTLSKVAKERGCIIPPNVWEEGEELVFTLQHGAKSSFLPKLLFLGLLGAGGYYGKPYVQEYMEKMLKDDGKSQQKNKGGKGGAKKR